MWFIIILGVIAFLLMEHPVAFWIVFVPLAILLIVSIGNFFKGRKGVGSFVTAWIIIIVMVVALVLVVSTDKCEHEDVVKMTVRHIATLDPMASYCHDNMGRELIAIVTVEEHTGDVESFELYDVAHAVSGRQKRVAKLTQGHREFTLSRLPQAV